MEHKTYLIVGAGMTADAAAHGIRELDRTGPIAVIGAATHGHSHRPHLSPDLWKQKPLQSIWRKRDDVGAEYHLGCRVVSLDAKNKQITDDEGTVRAFDKLLLATGATPRRFSPGGEQVIYYRTVDDYQRLRALTERGRR